MADEIFKTIFQMEGDAKGLVAELDKVNAKYVETNNIINSQQKQLEELMAREKKLLEARSKATNPTQALKLNQALEANKKAITETTAEINKLSAAENSADKNAQKLNKDIASALDKTRVIAMKNEVKNLAKQLTDTGTAGETATKKTINAFSDLRAKLKAAKGELAEAFGSGNQDAIDKASQKVGEIKDRINDLNETTNAYASGSNLQKIGNLFRDVASNLINLDFGRAQEQSEALVKTTRQLTFKEGVQGIKQLGATFANVGKALLANPIFLIASIIALIVSKFDALRNVGGAVGFIFNGLAKVINVLINAGKDLLDFLGLIDSTKKSLEELIDQQELIIKQAETLYDSVIAKRKAFNAATIQLERERTLAIQASLLKEVNDTKESMLERAASYEEFYEAYKKLIDLGIRASQIETSQTVRNIEIQIAAQNKLRELRRNTQNEINKGAEFNIKFGLIPDSRSQVQAVFALQRKEAEAARKEEIRQAKIDFADFDGGQAARAEINRKYGQIRINLAREEGKALIDSEKKLNTDKTELLKAQREAEVSLFVSTGRLTEMEVAEDREEILIEYYLRRRKIIEKAISEERKMQLDTTESKKELKQLELEAQEQFEAQENIKRTLRENAFSEEERHQLALFDLNRIYQRKISEILESQDSDRLKKQIAFEKERLNNLRKYNKEESAVVQAQNNKINELEKEQQEQEEEDQRATLIAVLDGIQQVTDALFTGINDLYTRKIAIVDKALERQLRATEEAREVAEKGNAELLEEEQKRLDDLNKEREKFVRRQQSLAVIELVTNSAIAITKAAAQGGVAAPFTIAATLIALISGLAQARAVASAAAFYEGGEYNGEGYTGNGDARSESQAVGKKPYTYHKQEYIFNHKTTSKYIDIFREVHKGNIDLNSWRDKVEAYETLKNMPIAMQVNDQGNEILILNGQMDKLIAAVEGQQSNVNLDGNGFNVYLKNIQSRNDYIKNNLAS